MSMTDEASTLALKLADEIKPLLAGKGPEVQGAVLAELVAMHIWGHQYIGDAGKTHAIRKEIFRLWCDLVQQLVDLRDREIGIRGVGRKDTPS